ncbi:MFS transporter [Peribacillus saganii]|uniref:MFS transporter n=1 Tax=Peribacillus saganii TaxID=2303992 RepID=UPI001F1BF21F|nr:MFS transporter [Peribacillus saganii]
MKDNNKQSVIALALITAICMSGDSMLYIILPTHYKEMGITSLIGVGVLLSVNRFVRLPLNPLIGFIYKKINFRTGILIAIFFSGITTIGYGFVKEFEIWVIMRSVWGFSWSLFKLGAYLLIFQLANDTNRGSFMGTYNGLYRLGSLFGMFLGGLFADLFGVALISTVIGLSAFFSLPILYKYVPKSLDKEVTTKNSPALLANFKTFKDRNLIQIFVTAFLIIMLLDGMLTASLSHIIQVKFTERVDILGLIVGAATLAGVIQAIRWGAAPFVVSRVGTALDNTEKKSRMLAVFLIIAFILLMIIPLNIPIMVWLPILLIHLLVSSSLTTIIDTVFSNAVSKVTNKVFTMTSFTLWLI